jgi:methylthioribose-1-phosphate isomerase
VIRYAHEQGKRVHVYVDETRPLLQGGRLTTWELEKHKIPYTLICDNMAAALMQQKKIDLAIVGADRIAMNGDFANKIGTYSLAINCQYHKVNFYTAAPVSTLDPKCKSGNEIDIELRQPEEVRGVVSPDQLRWAPAKAQTWNPAFDVTPAKLLTGIISDQSYLKQDQFKKLSSFAVS